MPSHIVSLLKLYNNRFPRSDLQTQYSDLSSSSAHPQTPPIITLISPSSSPPANMIYPMIYPDADQTNAAVVVASHPVVPVPFGYPVETVTDAPRDEAVPLAPYRVDTVTDAPRVEAVAVAYPVAPQANDCNLPYLCQAPIPLVNISQTDPAESFINNQSDASHESQDYLMVDNEEFLSNFFFDENITPHPVEAVPVPVEAVPVDVSGSFHLTSTSTSVSSSSIISNNTGNKPIIQKESLIATEKKMMK